MISSLKLPFAFDPDTLSDDLTRFNADDWTPHFNTQYYNGDWSGIALRTSVNAHVALYPDPTATEFVGTEMLGRCSYVPTVLGAFHCPLESVRFLRLGAGSEIREHKDFKLGFEDGVMRVHIPVVTDPSVEFYLDGERVNMKPGEVWYLNLNLKHRVLNRSTSDRVHLVIDCVVNDWMRTFFDTAVATAR